MQGCLRFFFTSISPNLAKYIYQPSALEQHHRIEKKKKTLHALHPQKITAFLLYFCYINNYIFYIFKKSRKIFWSGNL